MNVFRAIAYLWLIIAGVIVWIIAANVDRIVNGGELLGAALIFIGVYRFWKAYRTA